MVDLLFIFKVHQPYRLKKGFFWERNMFRKLSKGELFDYYFDQTKNKEIFDRAAKKCYIPSNAILLELIDEFKREKKKSKFLSAFLASSLNSVRVSPLTFWNHSSN